MNNNTVCWTYVYLSLAAFGSNLSWCGLTYHGFVPERNKTVISVLIAVPGQLPWHNSFHLKFGENVESSTLNAERAANLKI